MNAENFKALINQELKIEIVNIYLQEKNKELCFLRTLKPSEDNSVTLILSELDKLKKKSPKLYDLHRSSKEYFYFNYDEFIEFTEYKKIDRYFRSIPKVKIENCAEISEKIQYTVLEIFFTNREEILFLVPYTYNSFFKKVLLGKFKKEKFKLSNERQYILSFSPECILYKDELILTKNNSSIFNLKNYFENCLQKNRLLVEKVFSLDGNPFTNKNQLFYLTRGLRTGEFEKFSNFSSEKKKEKIELFQKKYKTRYKREVNVIYKNNQIQLNGMTAKDKEELIRLVTNRSALKILDEALTTSID